MTDLQSQLESLLFVSNKPLTLKKLSKFTNSSENDCKLALDQLSQQKKSDNAGIILLSASDGYQLATNSNNSDLVKGFLNSDLREALTDATVEVLAIIAYKQPISKAEIESIRGVNSQYSLRTLLMRGLIEKLPNPQDARGYVYQITTEFLQQLGITDINELPNYDEIVAKVNIPEPLSTPDNSEQTDSEQEPSEEGQV